MIDTQLLCEYQETDEGYTCVYCGRSLKRPAKRICPRMPFRRILPTGSSTGLEVAEKLSLEKEFNTDEVTAEFAKHSKNPLPLGDIVETVAKLLGADKVAAWYEKWTGKSCGCTRRKKWLNAAGAWFAGKVT